MKKSFLTVALLSVVAVLLAGCTKTEETPTPPPAPDTNAPAAPAK